VPARLTNQEMRVLSLAAVGLTSKEIADVRGISKYTVDDHVGSAMRKLGVSSRVAAVAEAQAKGLIDRAQTSIARPRVNGAMGREST
jgi:DNA-binding CsgD family transcriptional regulator